MGRSAQPVLFKVPTHPVEVRAVAELAREGRLGGLGTALPRPEVLAVADDKAATQQRLRADGVEYRARVHLGTDPEAHPAGEVGLDHSGDDVHRGALGGEHDVDAGGTRLLGEAHDVALHVLAGDGQEVGEVAGGRSDLLSICPQIFRRFDPNDFAGILRKTDRNSLQIGRRSRTGIGISGIQPNTKPTGTSIRYQSSIIRLETV